MEVVQTLKQCCMRTGYSSFIPSIFHCLGPTLISKFRPDLKKKYENIFGENDTRVMDYIYHCNAQCPR